MLPCWCFKLLIPRRLLYSGEFREMGAGTLLMGSVFAGAALVTVTGQATVQLAAVPHARGLHRPGIRNRRQPDGCGGYSWSGSRRGARHGCRTGHSILCLGCAVRAARSGVPLPADRNRKPGPSGARASAVRGLILLSAELGWYTLAEGDMIGLPECGSGTTNAIIV